MYENLALSNQFHGYTLFKDFNKVKVTSAYESKFTYKFYNHFHPYVGELLRQLNKNSLEGLLDAGFHESLEREFFADLYKPKAGTKLVSVTSYPKEIDVSEFGAYSVYNWELLFHIPLTIAVHLGKNQRFAEAQRWFHYIFDPTTNDGQFWRFIAFRKDRDVRRIDELLRIVSKPEDECTPEELEDKQFVLSGYETLRNNPFKPHAVARTRFLAYQYCVVMKYLDNLIAWGDSLFRQDTIETINEATQVYVLASNILGRKPEKIPDRGTIRPKSFAQLRAEGLDPLGNALVELEGQFPFNLFLPTTEGGDTDETNPLFGVGRTLYFCIPRNDILLGYWDTVADRLFKIRHCMNIEGVVRQLPLFQPPIDPGMLVRAAAAGIDISSLVSGLSQPLAPVRSIFLIQKALEICNEVRSLGNTLLSTLEKKDAEELGLLRQKHELKIQELAKEVRYLQWKEAESATDSLVDNRNSAVDRLAFYQRLLGGDQEQFKETTEFSLERGELTEENFDEVYNTLVQQYSTETSAEDFPERKILKGGTLFLSPNEDKELNVHLGKSKDYQLAAYALKTTAPILGMIPQFPVNLHYWGIGATIEFGGDQLSKAANFGSDLLNFLAGQETHDAGTTSKTAAYERRADDWKLQSNLAARELTQIGRRIISSLIHEQITRHEYENLKKQIEHSGEIDQFLHDKFTTAELYGWKQGELSKLYYECYKFTFDIARKAEQTMKHELMRPDLDARIFVKFNYWDGGRKGLLSGETLHLDLKRMEMAYHEHNKREYELTKHVSLRQLDPAALLSLKSTGKCEVLIPEWHFDLDTPGHYMRRIKNVSLSIPAVTGPYTSVNCTLALLKSSLRVSSQLKDDEYARSQDEDDSRFKDYYGTIQSIVTSNARNDSGLFETILRDERFLPFEGAGAESHWKLELPTDFRQFDYNSISDVVLHIRYTARQGGELLAKGAKEHLRDLVETANASGLVQLFSLRHDFPSEWYRFSSGDEDFRATVRKEYFPYLIQGEEIQFNEVAMFSVEGDELVSGAPEGLNLANLTTLLDDDGEFEITLPENNILKRDPDADTFLVFRFSVA